MVENESNSYRISCLDNAIFQPSKIKLVLVIEKMIVILGCVIFTLLSGKPAFEYTTMRDTYKRIVKLQYKIPDQLTPAGKI